MPEYQKADHSAKATAATQKCSGAPVVCVSRADEPPPLPAVPERYSLYGVDFVKGVPQGSYPFILTSVSLFDLGSTVSSPRPTRTKSPSRAEAVKDGALAPPKARPWTASSTAAHLAWSR